jgi:hypothetical protein
VLSRGAGGAPVRPHGRTGSLPPAAKRQQLSPCTDNRRLREEPYEFESSWGTKTHELSQTDGGGRTGSGGRQRRALRLFARATNSAVRTNARASGP